MEQKGLKEKKDKQKRIVTNEMKRKYSETQEERFQRLARERATGGSKRGRLGQGQGIACASDANVDPDKVMRQLEEKKQSIPDMLKQVDIEIIIKHDAEQSRMIGGMFFRKLRLVSNRRITLMHLGILVSFRNGLKEDEWPNFEFFPCLQGNTISQDKMKKLFLNGQLRPFKFGMTCQEIVEILNPGTSLTAMKIELIYKKKPMPQITTRTNMMQGPPPPVYNPLQSMGLGMANVGRPPMSATHPLPMMPQLNQMYGGANMMGQQVNPVSMGQMPFQPIMQQPLVPSIPTPSVVNQDLKVE